MAEKNEPAQDETTDSGNGSHGEGLDTLAPVIDEDGVIHEMRERPHESEGAPSGVENGRRSSGSTKRSSNKA